MRVAEREQGRRLAGPLAHLVDHVARRLHANESMHLHDVHLDVADCGYCYLRAGHTLGVIVAVAPDVTTVAMTVQL